MLTAALILAALAVVWLIRQPAPTLTFDEHTATAMALLQPDAPITAADEAQIDFVDAVLTDLHELPTTYDREYPR